MLRLTFEMAVDDAMIRKNPSKFKIADFLLGDAAECTALTKFQQEIYLEFIRKSGISLLSINYAGQWRPPAL